MAIWTTRGDKDSYELVVNANELMGFDLQASAVTQLGQAIVNRIVDRTQDGLDVSGRTFSARYSTEYKESFRFRSQNKTNRVNLTLFGTMMGLLGVKEVNGQQIIIGWNFTDEQAKAFNHDTGDTVPQRQFLGLSPSDERRLRRQFRDFRVEQGNTLGNLFNSIFGR